MSMDNVLAPIRELDEYQVFAARTINDKLDDSSKLFHAVFGLTSESGEVSGIMQKVYQGHDLDKEHIEKELGDCLWMIAEACTALNIKLSDVAWMNIDKLRRRYPEGFDAWHSLHRKDGDI